MKYIINTIIRINLLSWNFIDNERYCFVFFFIIFVFIPHISHGNELSVQIKTIPEIEPYPFEVELEAIINGGTEPYYLMWYLGDGTTSSLHKLTHLYRERGKYTLRLAIWDSKDNHAYNSKSIQISGDSIDVDNAVFDVYSNMNNIQVILQDKLDKHIFWIGTNGGLVKLDEIRGIEQVYRNEYPSLGINSLIQTNDGILWVGTIGGGLCRLDTENNQWKVFSDYNNNFPIDCIHSMLLSKKGNIWISRGLHFGYSKGFISGIIKFDPKTYKYDVFFEKKNLDRFKFYFQSVNDDIWGIHWGKIIHCNENTNLCNQVDINIDNLKDYEFSIQSILNTSDENIWVYITTWKKYKWAILNEKTEQLSISPDLNYDYQHITHQPCIQSRDGYIWASHTYDLLRFDTLTYEIDIFNTKDSKTGQGCSINYLMQSSDDAIWIGTICGEVIKFNYLENEFIRYDINNCPFQYNDIRSIVQDEDENIWANYGTGIGQYNVKDKKWTNIDMEVFGTRGFPEQLVKIPGSFKQIYTIHGIVWSIFQESFDGDTYIARYNLKNNSWSRFKYSINNELPHGVQSICGLNNNSILLGTYSINSFIEYLPDEDKFKIINLSRELPSSIIKLIQTKDGNIWIGTSEGLLKCDLSTGNLEVINDKIKYISEITQTNDGKIWIGTWYSHLLCFDQEINEFEVIGCNNWDIYYGIGTIIQAKDESIWIGKDIGLSRYDPKKNDWKFFKSQNSPLPNNVVKSLLQTKNGDIWAGTENGLCRISFPGTGISPGKLILIAGGGASKSNSLWPATKEITTMAYKVFFNRGFKHTDIYLVCPEKGLDFTGDGINDHIVDWPRNDEDRNINVNDINIAITDWAVKSYKKDKPLYIYIVDHGYPDDGINGPAFLLAPQSILYADKLDQMIDQYELETGGSTILINESCYSGQFLQKLKKQGRIVITSTKNEIANFSNQGTNTFSHFFLKELYQNKNLLEAYTEAISRIRKEKFTYNQTPQIDDNGDGISDIYDGFVASNIKPGGDFEVAAPWPEIISITYFQISDSKISFTVTTNCSMKGVWATIIPPGYEPDKSQGYLDIELDAFPLHDNNKDLIYNGYYNNFTMHGEYVFTFYARDTLHNTAVSKPIEIYYGLDKFGGITGQLNFYIDDYLVTAPKSKISISIPEKNIATIASEDGFFDLYGLPEGKYTLQVNMPIFKNVEISDVYIKAGKIKNIPKIPVKLIFSEELTSFDANNDNRIDLNDAIRIMQVLSGINNNH